MKAMVLSVSVVVMALSSSAFAAAPAKTKLGMMPAVQQALLVRETARKAGAVSCRTVYSSEATVECATVAGGKPVRAVTAFAACGAAAEDSCRARPVCTYRVSVSRGSPLAQASTRLVNVCRRGWVRLVVG